SRVHSPVGSTVTSSTMIVPAILLGCVASAPALVPPSPLRLRPAPPRGALPDMAMSLTTRRATDLWTVAAAGEAPSGFRAGLRRRLGGGFSGTAVAKAGDGASNNKTTSLFPRASGRRSAPPVSALHVWALRRLILAPAAARAAASATFSTPAFALGQRRVLSFAESAIRSAFVYLRTLNKRKVKQLTLIGLSIWALVNVVEARMAHKRQEVDATSEWGRYADFPSARGMALTVLMMRLLPYAIVPGVIEKFSEKKRKDDKDYGGYDTKEEYESSRPHRLRTRGGQLFADGLLRLGPLYIKIGQILSCQENLFPQEWIGAMERLQDRVPAKSGKDAWDLAYGSCPGGKAGFHTRFTDFDDIPLAAASLGQVHRARLRSTGDRVAIKIQRARLRDIYDKDLVLMKKIAKVADSLGKAGQVGGVEQSWGGIFDDAETILYREIDYRDEAENAIRFANDFGLGRGGVPIESTSCSVDGKKLPSAAEWLRTPYTYGELSSEKFLVMEYVPSIKVSNDAKLDEAGVTLEDREYLAESLAHSYLRQFCCNRFFSTDPHPGNLGVEVFEDGRAPRMVFYDFGQACSLSDDQSGGILEVVESIVDSDATKSVAAFSRMGVLKDNADLDMVQAKCQQNYDTGKLKVKKRKKRRSSKYRSSAGADRSELDARIDQASKSSNATESATETKDAEVMKFFTLKSEYAFVARALSQMDGVGKGLDPEFDFISAAAPYLVEVKGAGRYLMDEAKKRLKFVYDPDHGMLAREMALFKSLGWDPAALTTTNRKR
ncbi:hypothetical protein ACHAWF_017446, partial [Thalassiosira exigua]